MLLTSCISGAPLITVASACAGVPGGRGSRGGVAPCFSDHGNAGREDRPRVNCPVPACQAPAAGRAARSQWFLRCQWRRRNCRDTGDIPAALSQDSTNYAKGGAFAVPRSRSWCTWRALECLRHRHGRGTSGTSCTERNTSSTGRRIVAGVRAGLLTCTDVTHGKVQLQRHEAPYRSLRVTFQGIKQRRRGPPEPSRSDWRSRRPAGPPGPGRTCRHGCGRSAWPGTTRSRRPSAGRLARG
jgi:hypothetical protein